MLILQIVKIRIFKIQTAKQTSLIARGMEDLNYDNFKRSRNFSCPVYGR
jgi:hypothetical protein